MFSGGRQRVPWEQMASMITLNEFLTPPWLVSAESSYILKQACILQLTVAGLFKYV